MTHCSVAAVVLNVLTAQSLGLLLGAAVMNAKTAQTIAAVLMLSFMLVGGYYVRVSCVLRVAVVARIDFHDLL
jgi:hypothetical protein